MRYIFLWGGCLYFVSDDLCRLCKKAPFQNDQIHKVIGDNTNYSLDLCSTLKDAIGEEAVDFLEKLLAKDPKARPSAS